MAGLRVEERHQRRFHQPQPRRVVPAGQVATTSGLRLNDYAVRSRCSASRMVCYGVAILDEFRSRFSIMAARSISFLSYQVLKPADGLQKSHATGPDETRFVSDLWNAPKYTPFGQPQRPHNSVCGAQFPEIGFEDGCWETAPKNRVIGAGLPSAVRFWERRLGRLSESPLSQANAFQRVRRRAGATEIATAIGNHSFRTTGITARPKNDGTLERAATMANRASTRTTQFYDRPPDDVTLDEVERVPIQRARVNTFAAENDTIRFIRYGNYSAPLN